VFITFEPYLANNWSFTRSEAEFLEEARMLNLIDPDVSSSSGIQWQMVGFFMGLPDYNIPLKHVNGN